VEVESLKRAVAFASGRRYDLEQAPYAVDAEGLDAYELWRQALGNGEVNLRFAPGHARFLRQARECAAAYLADLAGRYPETPSLKEAAACYREEAGTAQDLEAVAREAFARDELTGKKHQRALGLLDAVLEAERRAVAEIEEALAALA
jgi:hypothetical protein